MARKKKKKSLPDFLASMQEAFESGSEQERQEQQAANQITVTRRHHNELQRAWEHMESCVVEYLKGESAQVMVNAISDLDQRIETVGFDERLHRLADPQSMPRLELQRDCDEVAICRLVIGVWAAIRLRATDPDSLISDLDAFTARISRDHVGFVQHVIENGGLTNCVQCGRQLAPSSLQRGRCGDCIASRKGSLGWLGVAIESDHKYGGQVYSGGVEVHFPSWKQWKFRLEEHFGHNQFSDLELWEKWIGHVCHHQAIDRSHFLLTPLTEAEAMLPSMPEKTPVTEDILLAREQSKDEAERIARIEAASAKDREDGQWEGSWDVLNDALRDWHRGEATHEQLIETLSAMRSLIASRGLDPAFCEICDQFDADVYQSTDPQNWQAKQDHDNAKQIAVLLSWLQRTTSQAGRMALLDGLNRLSSRPVIQRAYQLLPLLVHGSFPKLCEACAKPLPVIRFDRVNCSQCDHRTQVKREGADGELCKTDQLEGKRLSPSDSENRYSRKPSNQPKKTLPTRRKPIADLRNAALCACLMDAVIHQLWIKDRKPRNQLFIEKHPDIPLDARDFVQLRARVRSRASTPGYSLNLLQKEHDDRKLGESQGPCECYSIHR